MQDLPAPRWAHDPFRRHQWRFWDGERWTEHVSDDAVVGTDPPVGPIQPRPGRRPVMVDLTVAEAVLAAAPVAGGHHPPATGGGGLWADLQAVGGSEEHLVTIPAQRTPTGPTPSVGFEDPRTVSAVEIGNEWDDGTERTSGLLRLSRDSLLPEISAALVVVLLIAGAALIARSGANRPTAQDAVAEAVQKLDSGDPVPGASTKRRKVPGPKVSKAPKRTAAPDPVRNEPSDPAPTTTRRPSSPADEPTKTTKKPAPTQEPTATPSDPKETPTPEPTEEPSGTPSPSDGQG